MATLDQVIEMQRSGIPDSEISTRLQQQGISPREVNDSLNQAKIKNAVSPPERGPGPDQGMQASIMQGSEKQITARNQMTQEIGTEQPMPKGYGQPPGPEIYPPQQMGQGMPEYQGQPQEDYYPQAPQAYGGQDYYAPQQGMDTETISEIAEQVASEKIEEFKKKIGDIVSFKSTIQDRVNDIDDRLKRIEHSIDKLQNAVIGKIGEFGESSAMIHKDLDNLHGTVSKLMNPLIDNINEMKKIAR